MLLSSYSAKSVKRYVYAILRRPTSGDLYFKRDYKSVILDKLKRKEFLYVYYMPYDFMYMHFYHKKVLLILFLLINRAKL